MIAGTALHEGGHHGDIEGGHDEAVAADIDRSAHVARLEDVPRIEAVTIVRRGRQSDVVARPGTCLRSADAAMADRAQGDVIIGVVHHEGRADGDGIAGHGEGAVAAHRDRGARASGLIHGVSAYHIPWSRRSDDGHRAAFHGTLGSRHAAVLQTRGASDVIVGSPLPVLVPDHAGIFGMVDEGVAVVLVAVDGVVAVDFLLADGVLVAPAQQHGHGPGFDVGLVGHAAGAPVVVFAAVAHAHVEVAAGDVTLVFVDGFKHLARVALRDARSQLGAVARGVGGVIDLAEGIVAALRVDEAIGGIHVEEVAAGRGALVEPALRPGVLAVPAVAFLFVFATQARAQAVFVVGIDVPNLAVGFAVGVGEGVDEAAVAHHVVAFDDVVQGGLQFVAGLAVGVVIVAAGDLGH